MAGTPEHRLTHVVREFDEEAVDRRVVSPEPDAAFDDYAELARLLRAADRAGDREAAAQIRELMEGLWPALTTEQQARVEGGELDW
jgi:hypothetical protein